MQRIPQGNKTSKANLAAGTYCNLARQFQDPRTKQQRIQRKEEKTFDGVSSVVDI